MKINHSSIAVILSLLLFNMPSWAEKPYAPEKLEGTIRVDAEATVELIVNTPNLLIIDSRKENEFAKGHIQGAISLLDTEMTQEALTVLAPDLSTPLLFYCNGERCLRSSRAATQALGWGYKLVYWFRGGWNEWVEKGMPVSR